jgi:7-cyano-7-deazaguanine synthase
MKADSRPSPAIVLLSGGLDSATTLAIARDQGYRCIALTFDYGQRHRAELLAARRVAAHLHAAEHHFVHIDLRAFGQSALTADIPVPKDRSAKSMAAGIPITYVPARNTIFLSYALALAEVRHSHDIFLGVNAIDYSGYPDCRPRYIAAFERMANLATRAAVEAPLSRRIRLHTPLIRWPKIRIIRRGLALGVDYSLTHSCYDPIRIGPRRFRPCAHCDSCQIRQRAFAQLGLIDPVLQQSTPPNRKRKRRASQS